MGPPHSTTHIVYGANGHRSKKTVQGGVTTYYIGRHFEKTGGMAIKHIFSGNLRVATIKGSHVYYYHKNHQGSSTALTDASGAVVESSRYLPFGMLAGHAGEDVSNYKFTDQEYDAGSGLYFYRARYYDPAMGMFVTPDTVVPDPYDPQTLNRYSYCKNDPVNHIDPSGHEDETVITLPTFTVHANEEDSWPFSDPFDSEPFWNNHFDDIIDEFLNDIFNHNQMVRRTIFWITMAHLRQQATAPDTGPPSEPGYTPPQKGPVGSSIQKNNSNVQNDPVNLVDQWGLEGSGYGWSFSQSMNYFHNQGLAPFQSGYRPSPASPQRELPGVVKQGGILVIDTAAQAAAVHLAKEFISPVVGGALSAINWVSIVLDPLPPPAGDPMDMYYPYPENLTPTPPPDPTWESGSPCN